MRSVKINGKHYAVGLWWQVLKGTKKRDQLDHIRKQVAEFKEEHFNCYAIRKSQFGLGNLEGKIKSYPSLACALIDRTPDTWLGRFLLEESEGKQLWWVCAVKEGKPLADGDAIFTSLEEADNHLKKFRAISQWETEILTDTVDGAADQFKGLIKPAQRLRSIEERRIPTSLKLAILFLLIVSGYTAYTQYEEQKLAEFKRIQQQMNAKNALDRRKELEEAPEQFFPRTWEQFPDVAHVATLCLPIMQNIPLYNNGWALQNTTCDLKTIPPLLKTEWSHTKGARFDALPILFGDIALLNTKTPTKAISSYALHIEYKRPSKELYSTEKAVGVLYQITAAAQAHINVTWSEPKTHKVSDVIGKPLFFTSPWRHCKWTLSGIPSAAITGQSLLNSLHDLPGVVINHITYLPQGWTITGELYAKN